MPLEPSAMAASMAWDWASASLFEPKYVTSTPRSAAACSTAVWTTDQKTPSSPWVMTWKCRSRLERRRCAGAVVPARRGGRAGRAFACRRCLRRLGRRRRVVTAGLLRCRGRCRRRRRRPCTGHERQRQRGQRRDARRNLFLIDGSPFGAWWLVRPGRCRPPRVQRSAQGGFDGPEVRDALGDVAHRALTGRGLSGGDGHILFEHVAAVVAVVLEAVTTSAIGTSPSPSGANRPS